MDMTFSRQQRAPLSFFDPIICGWKSGKLSSSRLHQGILSHPDTLFSSRNSCCLSLLLLLLQLLLLLHLLLLLQLLLLLLLQPTPAALKSSQDCRREGKLIRPRQRRCWHIRLEISEDVPPPDVVHMVVLPSQSEFFAAGECVISPPDSARHPVGQQHVYTIVAS